MKRLFATLSLAPDTPEYAIVDENRLMQIIKCCWQCCEIYKREGGISITAFVAKSDSSRDPRAPEFFPVPSHSHFYLRTGMLYIYIVFFLAILLKC